MNKEALLQILKDFVKLNKFKSYGGSGLAYLLENTENCDATQLPDYVVNHEAQEGGEDQGSIYFHVYSVTDKKTHEVTYVEFDAWYSSEYGREYNDPDTFSIVEPRDVVVKQWFVKT